MHVSWIASLLLGVVVSSSAVAARAGEVRFSGVLPNGALIEQRVESMQERRFRNLVRQHTDYSCGAAALATILKYAYHLDADEATVIEGMMGVSDQQLVRDRGFSLLDIKRYVESMGMRGRGYRVDEARLRNLRVPGLVLMDVRGFRHFVVMKQVRGDIVEVADPILGNRSLPLAEFLEAWPSRAVFIVIGSDFDRNSVLLQPSERPSARALYARQGPITDAELVDFGFSHADLF
ncbi:C39 family peptidase [Stenotrophomonas sp. WHRI 8082]|uniref:C39 family peptidase n=1 Tax=unclassified Stenotrophomonas TaxID=196198 RepID=UPI00177F46A7|nr:C39 family peptidase [Stenotrophomonas sp. CFBP 13718]MBD8696237.1 C39 family peptidase [Stenotrophomonas sp. CFBP 13718]